MPYRTRQERANDYPPNGSPPSTGYPPYLYPYGGGSAGRTTTTLSGSKYSRKSSRRGSGSINDHHHIKTHMTVIGHNHQPTTETYRPTFLRIILVRCTGCRPWVVLPPPPAAIQTFRLIVLMKKKTDGPFGGKRRSDDICG